MRHTHTILLTDAEFADLVDAKVNKDRPLDSDSLECLSGFQVEAVAKALRDHGVMFLDQPLPEGTATVIDRFDQQWERADEGFWRCRNGSALQVHWNDLSNPDGDYAPLKRLVALPL